MEANAGDLSSSCARSAMERSVAAGHQTDIAISIFLFNFN